MRDMKQAFYIVQQAQKKLEAIPELNVKRPV
jgi:hypothetical protein